MNMNEAIEKAAKLLRLATSSNPHEAALAAARAQEIIDRYKLNIDGLNTEAEPESAEPVRDYGSADPVDNTRDVWRGILIVGICSANDCKAYKSGPALCLIGRPADVQTVRYMYGYLTRQIEHMTAISCRGSSRTYWNNFRHGMVETIINRLKEQRAATVTAAKQEAQQAQNAGALVRIDRALIRMEATRREVEQVAERLHLRSRSSRTTYNNEARARGREAGQRVGLNRAAGAVGRGAAGYVN